MNDQEVINQVLSGAKNSYAILVKKYQTPLLNYLSALTGYPELAQDAAQSAFIKAYMNLNSYKADYQFSSWLYRIAHNEAMNMFRKDKRQVPIDFEQLDASLVVPNSILGDLEKVEQREILFSALQKLNTNEKQALTLYYFADKSYVEIADIMQTSKNNVGSYISRAKNKLKIYLELKSK